MKDRIKDGVTQRYIGEAPRIPLHNDLRPADEQVRDLSFHKSGTTSPTLGRREALLA